MVLGRPLASKVSGKEPDFPLLPAVQSRTVFNASVGPNENSCQCTIPRQLVNTIPEMLVPGSNTCSISRRISQRQSRQPPHPTNYLYEPFIARHVSLLVG